MLDRREREYAQGRKTLLAVDDEKLAVTLPLDHKRAHVMSVVGPAAQFDDVVPQILPVLLLPGVVTLVWRNAVDFAVADQLEEIRGTGIQEIRLCHRVTTFSNRAFNEPPADTSDSTDS